MKIANITTFKLIKKMGGAAVVGLQVYRNILALKVLSIDLMLKAVKSQHHPLPQKSLPTPIKETKEKKEMKKSNGFAVFMFFAAVCSALGAVAYYLYKKEKELGDYEDMLFSEEYLEGYMPEDAFTDDDCCADACACDAGKASVEEPTFE